jgi:hypothetical protein
MSGSLTKMTKMTKVTGMVSLAGMTLTLMVLTLATATIAAAQDSMSAARDLYASAAYEDALAVLNRLPKSGRPSEESRAIEQYRAFCLLALGRTAEAERSIEAIIAGEPNYMPTDSEVSPRVRAAFADVRKRMLPTLVQQSYSAAKSAYDRKDFAAAAAGFNQVLDQMNDPDLRATANQPPLSDIHTLAVGFRDLSAAAAAPPPPPVPAASPTASQAAEAASSAPSTPAQATGPRIYSSADAGVVPPVPLAQDLPPYKGTVLIPRQGMLEVVIDETGGVESAVMRASVTNAYDSVAVNAARGWHYRPATLNGTPVKFRKMIQVSVKAAAR